MLDKTANVKTAILFEEFLPGIQLLSDEQRGKLLMALYADMGSCEAPELDQVTQAILSMMLPRIHRMREKYATRCEKNRKNAKQRRQTSDGNDIDNNEDSKAIATDGYQNEQVDDPEANVSDCKRSLTIANDRNPSQTIASDRGEIEQNKNRTELNRTEFLLEKKTYPPNPPSQGGTVGGSSPSQSRSRDRPKKTDAPSKGDPRYQGFLSCWQVWPKKQAQESAWKEWCRLSDNGTLAEPYVIREAIMRMTSQDSQWARGYIPAFDKWLSGKRWEDEPFAGEEDSSPCDDEIRQRILSWHAPEDQTHYEPPISERLAMEAAND